MECTVNRCISVSRCGADGKMRLDQALDEFMDLSAIDSTKLNHGVEAQEKLGLHWVVVKNKIRVFEAPRMFQELRLMVDFRKTEGLNAEREFAFLDGDKPMIAGKSQFVILDNKTGKPVTDPALYNIDADGACKYVTEPFEKIRLELSGEPFSSYRVQPCDIDFVHHMNNCAYLRAFQNQFTTEQWQQMNITDFEIHYIRSAKEGDIIDFRKKSENGKNYYQLSVGEKTIVVIITN